VRTLLLSITFTLILWAGPIQTNYFHPNQWMMYNPIGKDLVISDTISVGLINTSVFETESYYADEYIFDAEITALLLQGHKTLSKQHRLDFSLPLYAMHGGIMDGLINEFHHLLNIGTPRDRNNEVYNQFRYLVKDGGTTIIDESGSYSGIGNFQVDLVSKWLEGSFELGSLVGIKIPLNQDPVVTTGKIDIATGLILHKAFNDKHHLYSNLLLTYNTPYDLRTTTQNNVVRFFGLLSYNYVKQNKDIFIVEYKFSSPPFDDGVIEFFYEVSRAMNIGYQFSLGKDNALEIFVLEDDFPYKNYSDISFAINYKHTFRR